MVEAVHSELKQYQLVNSSLSVQHRLQANPLVTTLFTDVSHLDLLQGELVSVRSTQSGVLLGEDEDVGEVDDENAEGRPGQRHERLIKDNRVSRCGWSHVPLVLTLYMPPQVEFSLTNPAGQVWYFSLYRAAVKNTAMARNQGQEVSMPGTYDETSPKNSPKYHNVKKP